MGRLWAGLAAGVLTGCASQAPGVWIGEHRYATLADAAAAAEPNAVLHLESGPHKGNVRFPWSVTLEADSDAVIRGAGTTAITASGDLRLRGLRVVGGVSPEASAVRAHSALVLEDTEIEGGLGPVSIVARGLFGTESGVTSGDVHVTGGRLECLGCGFDGALVAESESAVLDGVSVLGLEIRSSEASLFDVRFEDAMLEADGVTAGDLEGGKLVVRAPAFDVRRATLRSLDASGYGGDERIIHELALTGPLSLENTVASAVAVRTEGAASVELSGGGELRELLVDESLASDQPGIKVESASVAGVSWRGVARPMLSEGPIERLAYTLSHTGPEQLSSEFCPLTSLEGADLGAVRWAWSRLSNRSLCR